MHVLKLLDARMHHTLSLISAGSLVLAMSPCGIGLAADSPIQIVSVDPAPASTYIGNPDPRLVREQHPARFRVTIENATEHAYRGVLVPEVIANLQTVYELPRQSVELVAGERRTFAVSWLPPSAITFHMPGRPVTIPAALWGHEFRATLLDTDGAMLDRGQTSFAVADDHSAEILQRLTKLATRSPRDAFQLRYSGYLENPAFTPTDSDRPFSLTISSGQVTEWQSGTAPSGFPAFIGSVAPLAEAGRAIVKMKSDLLRLRQVWLLAPDHPQGVRAQRLYHLADQKRYTFEVPPAGQDTRLVL